MPGWRETEHPLHEKLDRDLLVRAYRFSEQAHRGQLRNSGDPYITHSVEVAKILADLQLDSITVEGTGAAIVDTRKTTPGLRLLEKYAVMMGGGHNHRMGLYDAVMIKDNHIVAARGIHEKVDTSGAARSYGICECEA